MNQTDMSVESLIDRLKTEPDSIEFQDVVSVIATFYDYFPSGFTNGELKNDAGTNEGSCKLFAFAKLHSLNENETLSLFGDYYRIDVLQNPEGSDHQNIRNFMETGWRGVVFDGQVLTPKP